MRSSPLIDVEKAYGANLGQFAGWLITMDFGDPINECKEVRLRAGLFDISHMGRLVIKGFKSYEFLQKLATKDLSKLRQGEMSGPALILNKRGGIKDDVMLYKLSDHEWLMVCNAANTEKNLQWMKEIREELKMSESDVVIEDITDRTVLLALQGPKSPEVLESLGIEEVKTMKLLNFIPKLKLRDSETFLVSRSGWTGEEVRSYGFEILSDIPNGIKIYRELLEAGVRPSGLVARDILRTEMGYVLYGSDIDEDVNPIEARYWIALTRGKEDCIGCQEVWSRYKEGVKRFRFGFKMKKDVKAIPRHGYRILAGDEVVGEVTSGAYSPTLERCVGMGYINTSHAYLGFSLDILIRDKRYEVKISDFPLI
ncbi:MAG: glycine cleavage system aminomethyltransferase GcvT [Sulfolobales archaeon]|nr:glycine cleavage system aminomethyltransferase GcvT [Sulfolobales archaeon]MDW7969975.1 glycine cleavage system aminomethyltransferase GcvT [Sulfolobales archaeon]